MIKTIEIINYRNLENIKEDLSDKINFIIEPNATGKTNFLESIYYAIFGTSFRNLSMTEELIGPSDKFAKIHLHLDKDELEAVIANVNNRITRKFILNKKSTSQKKLPYKFGILLFAPHTVDLTSGEPSIRRKDLDSFLSICFEKYFDYFIKYTSVHKNRNALIKQIRDGFAERKELEYWTEQLIATATQIYNFRYKFFNEINIDAKILGQEIYREFQDFKIKYLPNIEAKPEEFEEALRLKFSENIEKEIIVGKTLYGVHKDDYQMLFNGKDLRYFGSRGQQRIGSFIFKIGQFYYYKKLKDESPVILVDDIMSELDVMHRENIAKTLLKLDSQIILTGADEKEIPVTIKKKGKQIIIN